MFRQYLKYGTVPKPAICTRYDYVKQNKGNPIYYPVSLLLLINEPVYQAVRGYSYAAEILFPKCCGRPGGIYYTSEKENALTLSQGGSSVRRRASYLWHPWHIF